VRVGREITQRLLAGATRAELAAAGVGWVLVEGPDEPLDLPWPTRIQT
jgi:hypothetical protein